MLIRHLTILTHLVNSKKCPAKSSRAFFQTFGKGVKDMLDYYIELVSKPAYLLSESERLFIDLFPILIVGVICLVVMIISAIIEIIKRK